MNLHLLRVFFEVAQRRSFSRAAEALFVSQPAVSKAVRELERQLGLPLIERAAPRRHGARAGPGPTEGRGVRLTDGGRALLEHARGIFSLERAALDDVRARVGRERGRLSIGASTTIAGYWIAPYLAALLARSPAIEVQVRVGNTATIAQALVDCEIDVALVEGAVHDARIEALRWRDEAMGIVVASNDALARRRVVDAKMLDARNWVVREAGSGTREVGERLMRAHGIEPARTIELGSNEGIARAVAAGVGLALLPESIVRELRATGAVALVRYPRELPLSRPLYRLLLRERPASPLASAFCELLSSVDRNAARGRARCDVK
ncbi:MAG: LysR substrate-binding domain-containing protein [Burkholderiaceae bacterium]|nr:LysR substrate-binding domain-containing protein [Burkholderiaceae bacterium]